MTARELYRIFADPHRPWSPWTKPILFAELENRRVPRAPIPAWNGPTLAGDAAWILDLPGTLAFSAALAGLRAGLCPVPLYNGADGPNPVVDVRPLAGALIELGERFAQTHIPHAAPPMFMIDAARAGRGTVIRPGLFDNRWMVFPQDLPSFRFLRGAGITRVNHLSTNGKVAEDIAHVLRRWQDGGLELFEIAASGGSAKRLRIRTPSHFRRFFRRALVLWGLRRSSGGGFGAKVPEPSETSGARFG